VFEIDCRPDSPLNSDVPAPKWNPKLRLPICLALGLATLALYLPSVGHEFIDYDDQQYVTDNLRVRAGLGWESVGWAFGYHAGNWHPLTWLSHMLDCQLYGLKAGGHHLTNLLLHAVNAMLLFLGLSRMTKILWRSAAVAALFAWHPLHVESVAWVAERKDLLCACFWLLTMGAYARYAEATELLPAGSGSRAPVRQWYALALGAFALALMSKPMAVTLPFVLLLLDYWPLHRLGRKRVMRLLGEKLPFFALSLVTCALTLAAQKLAIVSTRGLPVSERLLHAIVAYAHYLGTLFVPRGLAVYYPYETGTWLTVMLATGVLAAITVLAWSQAGRRPYLATGWLWYLGTLVPVIGLVQVGDQAWADRYTYLPSIGAFIGIVWLGAELIPQKKVLATIAGTLGVALLAGTTLQLRHWQNTRTLFTHAEQVTRNNHMAVTLLGSLLAKEGKYDEAMACYRQALSYRSNYAEVHFFLGHALDQQGKLDEAIAEYNRALASGQIREQTHIFLGVALGKQKKTNEAAAHYRAALELDPESAVAHNNLARLLQTQGRLDEAHMHYTQAVKLDPSLAPARNNFGILLLQQGKLAEGAAQLREAVRLNPQDPESQFNLALALNQQGRWQEAAEFFARTVSANSTDPNAHYQFGLALARLGRTREAMSRFASALLIQPDFPNALDGLAWILATSPNQEFRNGMEAVRMAGRACELTGHSDALKLKTLAAAQAEAGQFEAAARTLQSAYEAATKAGKSELLPQYVAMRERFTAAQPWREASEPGEQGLR